MRFQTRAFLISFLPFAALLAGSFLTIQHFVQTAVRDGLRTSLRKNQLAIGRMNAKAELQNSRFLKVVGENAALKAGMQLLASDPGGEGARRTVEDQLLELGEHMGFDFLLIASPNGKPMAAVLRQPDSYNSTAPQLVPLDPSKLKSTPAGLITLDGRIVQVASMPIDEDRENLGSLAVGSYFDFSEFASPVLLIESRRVVRSTVPNISLDDLNASLQSCDSHAECDLHLHNQNWISLPIAALTQGTYSLRTLENVDTAAAPVQAILNRLFLAVALGSVLLAMFCSVVSSRSIVKPISAFVAHLRNSAGTGVLPHFKTDTSRVSEIRHLAESYNRAADSVQNAQEDLQVAYIEFVGSLANALDARDPYTAGHSHRVSHLSCATARAMSLAGDDIERIRIGALLHDIGKIGVADAVLQKPGKLTDDEFAQVKQHPVIGRRILEGVRGFAPYLDAVELHHENWAGTGYPRKQSGEQTPIEARIIHVSDAYDAMTTDRSYRRGMTHEKAIGILQEFAGIQFDPYVVATFLTLPREITAAEPPSPQSAPAADRVEILELV